MGTTVGRGRPGHGLFLGFVLEEAEAAYGKPFGTRGRVIPNGVSLKEVTATATLQHTRQRPYVVAAGRLVPQKGFDLLLRAFSFLPAEYVGYALLIAGEGPERDRLRSLIAELDLQDRVCLLGRQSHGQVLSLFRGADVFVLPSRHEPQGIVVLEAMATDTPVLAARVGGVAEVVEHEVNGLLFQGSDANDLARSLVEILRDPAKRTRLVAAARTTAAAFDWPLISDRYEAAYQATGAAKS